MLNHIALIKSRALPLPFRQWAATSLTKSESGSQTAGLLLIPWIFRDPLHPIVNGSVAGAATQTKTYCRIILLPLLPDDYIHCVEAINLSCPCVTCQHPDRVHQSETYTAVRPKENSSSCSLVKWAVTVVCLNPQWRRNIYIIYLNICNVEIFLYKPRRPNLFYFLNLKSSFINVLVCPFWFIWISMLWVYDHY